MSEDLEKGIALLSSGALVTSVINLLRDRKVVAASSDKEFVLDEATIKLLIAIAQTEQEIDDNLAKLIKAVSILGGNIELLNPSDFTSFVATPTAANTALRLPSRVIPYRHSLVIKAYHTNLGIIYVGHNSADAVNANAAYPLIASEAVELQIRNSDRVWISATNLGDSVACIVEQE